MGIADALIEKVLVIAADVVGTKLQIDGQQHRSFLKSFFHLLHENHSLGNDYGDTSEKGILLLFQEPL